MRGESDQCSCDVALEGRLGQAYSEGAFRYLLKKEWKRAERSGHPFLLLIVDLKDRSRADEGLDPMLAAKLFSSLWLCLRETDFIGWYREGRVAGAVLTLLGDGPLQEVSRQVRQRVREVLCESLPSEVTRRLHVRVCQFRPRLKNPSSCS